MNTELVSIHYGELALKKRNRAAFENKLLANLRAKLDLLGVIGVRKLPGRILVEFGGPTPWSDITGRIRNVFGFSKAYPVHRTALCLEELESMLTREAVKLNFNSFAIRTKRANKKFPITSPEINARLGAAIKGKTSARVDLKNPERIFNIEILDRDAFFSYEVFRGPGGLPTGTGGYIAALLSGGIDSPVASWMMMKRGLVVSFIHFHSAPFTDGASIEKVEDIAGYLAGWQGGARLALVPFGKLQQKIATSVPAKYRVVLYRRFMMRIAGRIARETRAAGLVTGEALGQVASQTLANLASIEAAADLPVFRPLIGMDKQEIVDAACKIGTYDASIEPHQDCCSFLQPRGPATRTTPEEMDRVESCLDVDSMVEDVLREIEWREINGE